MARRKSRGSSSTAQGKETSLTHRLLKELATSLENAQRITQRHVYKKFGHPCSSHHEHDWRLSDPVLVEGNVGRLGRDQRRESPRKCEVSSVACPIASWLVEKYPRLRRGDIRVSASWDLNMRPFTLSAGSAW